MTATSPSTLPGVIAPLPPGSIVLDTVADLTPALIRAIKAARISPRKGEEPRPVAGVMLYLRYDDHRSRWDWDRRELELALAAGLACGFVQRCRGRWHPTGPLGLRTGQEAVENLLDLGVPQGAQAWLDVEGEMAGTPSEEVAYCEQWAAAVRAAGYLAGRYVGAGSKLDGRAMYALKGITAYWDSLSDVRRQNPLPRGYCMEQVRVVRVGGVDFDLNVVGTDRKGGAPLWMMLAERPA
jgi:hypothetical protein